MSSKDKIKTNSLQLKKAMKCESLDEGTFAFLNWMNCKSFDSEGYEQNPPLTLKYVDFPKIGLVRLFDRFLGQDILVNIVDWGTIMWDMFSRRLFTCRFYYLLTPIN